MLIPVISSRNDFNVLDNFNVSSMNASIFKIDRKSSWFFFIYHVGNKNGHPMSKW